ncbi:MAG: site-specific integrase [Proteobacteria bacterium]|nr:site-specific integrase [Pseudomonadota bacterium]
MMGMHTKDVLTQALRDVRDLYPRMIDRRAEEDIDAALCAKLSFSELRERYQNARIYAALNELAFKHGPNYSDFAAKYLDGQACRIYELTAMLQENWRLDHVECEKVAHRIERGYLREVYRPGSTVAGVLDLDTIVDQIRSAGLEPCKAAVDRVCRTLAEKQAEYLWAAAGKYALFIPGKGAFPQGNVASFVVTAPKITIPAHNPLPEHPFCDEGFEIDCVVAEPENPTESNETTGSKTFEARDDSRGDGEAQVFPSAEAVASDQALPSVESLPFAQVESAISTATGQNGQPDEQACSPMDADPARTAAPEAILSAVPPSPDASRPETEGEVSLAALVEDLIEAMGNKWRTDSQQQHRSVAALFSRFAGGNTTRSLTPRNIDGYFAMLSELPSNYNKRPADARLDLTTLISQARAKNEELGLSPATINRHLTQLKAIVRYAQDMGHIPRIELSWERYQQKDERDDDEKRNAFSVKEVMSILQHPTWTDATIKAPWSAYWIPLLAAYTGARMGELASLRVKDVDTLSAMIDIRPTPDRLLKTKASERKIPLHSELIRLGFLNYVDAVEAHFGQGSTLFVDLGDVGPKKTHSDRFQKKWLKILGETIADAKSRDLSFHSFRHYTNIELERELIPDGIRVRFLGHESSGVNGSTYNFSRKKPPVGVYDSLLTAFPVVSSSILPLNWAGKVASAHTARPKKPMARNPKSKKTPLSGR